MYVVQCLSGIKNLSTSYCGWVVVWCRCMEPPPGVAKVPASSLRCGLSWCSLQPRPGSWQQQQFTMLL